MSELPFSMSPEAAVYVERMLIDAQRMPETIFRACVVGGGPRGTFLGIGWHECETVSNGSFEEFELVGFRVFMHEKEIPWLRGKRIELKHGVLVTKAV